MTSLASTAHAAALKDLAGSNPWTRFIMPSISAAGYFTRPTGARGDLTGAGSPACDPLKLHRSETLKGIERVIMVSKTVVLAHGRVRFAPRGYHLMSKSPPATLKPDAVAPVSLTFADGTTLTADFSVRGPTDK